VQERIAPRAAQYALALERRGKTCRSSIAKDGCWPISNENAAASAMVYTAMIRWLFFCSTNTSHEHEFRFYFAASSSFIACRANEKSRTSSNGRFFSPTRAIIASISRSVIMPSRLSVLSSPS
jgi:hypothetical protein